MAITRRHLLTAGAAGAGVLAAGAVGLGVGHATAASEPASAVGTEPFFGVHPAGIATAQQDRLLFAAYDVTVPSAAALAPTRRGLDCSRGPDDGGPRRRARGVEHGIAAGRHRRGDRPRPRAFDDHVRSRAWPLRTRRRRSVRRALPPSCSARRPSGVSRRPARPGPVRWRPVRASVLERSAGRVPRHPQPDPDRREARPCFGGHKRGSDERRRPLPTRSRRATSWGSRTGPTTSGPDSRDFDGHVWVTAADGPDWMVDGTYLVARRIRMHIEVWDRSSLQDQEQTIGRTKLEGAPLGAAAERDPVDLGAHGSDGEPVIPADSHIRLANQEANAIFLLRRGYSFTDGIDPQTGQFDAGLFFLAFQRDPRTQFVPLQQTLGRPGRAQRVHPARRLGVVRHPAGCRERRPVDRGCSLRLSRRPECLAVPARRGRCTRSAGPAAAGPGSASVGPACMRRQERSDARSMRSRSHCHTPCASCGHERVPSLP